MKHKNLLLILFFCLFLTPFMANGATVGGYFQIDVNVLRDGNNNPISLNNIALYRDEQSTFPEFFTGETIYEGYSYTSLYQELTVGESYVLSFGNMSSYILRENLTGFMVIKTTSANCNTACSSIGFLCDVTGQRTLASNITGTEINRVTGIATTAVVNQPAAPAATQSNNGSSACNGTWSRQRVIPTDISQVACDGAAYYAYTYCRSWYRICACGGWKIVVTI